MTSRYVHHDETFRVKVLNSPVLAEKLHARGERAAAAFRATAPVGSPHEDDHPGRFRDSVRVATHANSGPNGDRVQTRVHVDDPHGLSIEFGHTAYRDARGRFSRAPTGRGPEAVEHIEGTRTLTHAMDAAR